MNSDALHKRHLLQEHPLFFPARPWSDLERRYLADGIYAQIYAQKKAALLRDSPRYSAFKK